MKQVEDWEKVLEEEAKEFTKDLTITPVKTMVEDPEVPTPEELEKALKESIIECVRDIKTTQILSDPNFQKLIADILPLAMQIVEEVILTPEERLEIYIQTNNIKAFEIELDSFLQAPKTNSRKKTLLDILKFSAEQGNLDAVKTIFAKAENEFKFENIMGIKSKDPATQELIEKVTTAKMVKTCSENMALFLPFMSAVISGGIALCALDAGIEGDIERASYACLISALILAAAYFTNSFEIGKLTDKLLMPDFKVGNPSLEKNSLEMQEIL